MSAELVLLDEPSWTGTRLSGDRTVELLACLVLAGTTGMSTTALIDDLWPDEPPANSGKALQVVVSRARKATTADLVERTAHGYRLGTGIVDAVEIESRTAEAAAAWRQGLVGDAVGAARAAVAVPIGSADGDSPLARLRDRARRSQMQARRTLALALASGGSPIDALPELEATYAADPADEEVLSALLLAETAVRGAPAALDRYEQARADLAERLGLDPGETLQRTHAQILAADRPQREGVRYDADELVGRDDDLKMLLTLLERNRVVTILGPGGLGKTRMAHLVARNAPESRVHFVELVGVRDGDDVVAEVGSALGVRESVGVRGPLSARERADLRSRIAAHLDRAPSLLVLDNCEHVIAAAADLVGFVAASTKSVRILTTSRSPLAIGAEHVYSLGQLDLNEAEYLFGLRAAATRPSIVLDSGEVRALVARLDGLPLAIELAAAKTRVMTVAEIGQRLDSRFELLQGTDPTAPDRHRTLMAVIDWSWTLLTDRQQVALRRLAAFSDGFTLDGAESVVGRTALDDVQGLVEQSLLSVTEARGRTRFRMLETVREFGLLHLAEAGEESEVQRSLRIWAVGMVADVAVNVFSERQIDIVDRLLAEETNLSDVLRGALSADDVESAVMLAASLFQLWTVRGDIGRLLVLAPAIDALLADYRPAAHAEDATRLAGVVIVAMETFLGEPITGNARSVLQRLGPGTAPYIAAFVRVTEVLTSGSEPEVRQGLIELADASDRLTRLLALQWCARLEENIGLRTEARERVEMALAVWRPEDGSWARATLELNLAQLAAQSGDFAAGARHAAHALPDLIRLGAIDDIGDARALMATEAIRRGDLDLAASLLPREPIDGDGDPSSFGGVSTLAVRAELQIAQGHLDEGLASYRRMAEFMSAPIPGLGSVLEVFAVYGLAVASVAHALHGTGEDLLEELARRFPAALADERRIDYPVLGSGLFGFGMAGLLLERVDPSVAATALALAKRFNYVGLFAAYDWDRGEELLEQVRPGALAAAERRLGKRKGPELLEVAQALSFSLR